MAKLPFSKLGIKVNNDIVVVHWNDQVIEVQQYLPMSEKLELMNKVINNTSDNNGFYNPLQLKVLLSLEIMYYYTNLNFTDKQKENVLKLYDTIMSSGLFTTIMQAIPQTEYEELWNGIEKVITNIYAYQNSALGILESVKQDYSNLNFDAEQLQQNLGDPENLQLLKDVLTKLG